MHQQLFYNHIVAFWIESKTNNIQYLACLSSNLTHILLIIHSLSLYSCPKSIFCFVTPWMEFEEEVTGRKMKTLCERKWVIETKRETDSNSQQTEKVKAAAEPLKFRAFSCSINIQQQVSPSQGELMLVCCGCHTVIMQKNYIKLNWAERN